MKTEQGAGGRTNETPTCSDSDARLTQRGSRPVRYELVRRDGEISPMKFESAAQAAEAAGLLWPGEEQDEDRTGKGWDIQVVGS